MENGFVITCSLGKQYFHLFCSSVLDLTVYLGMGELIEESEDSISSSLASFPNRRQGYE
jgi:hypothetical protein